MWELFKMILRRDLMLAMRRKSDLAQVIFFFAVVVTLVPLGVGAETNTLRAIAPGVVWVAALLAALLSLPRIFAADYADGTLEQMLLAAEPLPVIVVAKVIAHWLVTGVPMTVFATVFGRRNARDGRGALFRDPCALLYRGRRRGVNARIAHGWGAHEFTRASALHSGAHFRSWGFAGCGRGHESDASLHDCDWLDTRERRTVAYGDFGSTSHCGKLINNEVRKTPQKQQNFFRTFTLGGSLTRYEFF